MVALGRCSRTALMYAGDISMATAFTLCPGTFELFPEGIKGVTPFAVTNENHAAPVSMSKTTVRYRCPLRTEISSMAIRLTFFKHGLENRLVKSLF